MKKGIHDVYKEAAIPKMRRENTKTGKCDLPRA